MKEIVVVISSLIGFEVLAVLNFLLADLGSLLQPYFWTREILNSQAGKRDSRGLLLTKEAVAYTGKLFSIEDSYWTRLDIRLSHLGREEDGKTFVTKNLIDALVISLPLLILPVWMKSPIYVLVFPIFMFFVFSSNMKKLQNEYNQWERALINQIPEVVDQLSICFAGGRNYMGALEEARLCCGAEMGQALEVLLEEIQVSGVRQALIYFTSAFDMPQIQRLSTAISIAVESGFSSARNYLKTIEEEVRMMRKQSVEDRINKNMAKVNYLYAALFGISLGALILKGIEIVQALNGMLA